MNIAPFKRVIALALLLGMLPFAAFIIAPEPASAASGKAVIRAVGDVIITEPMLKFAYDKQKKRYDFTRAFSMIGDSLSMADFTIANVEGPMGGKGKRGFKGYPTFNTPPKLLDALKAAGVDMLTLANNHSLDTGFDGLVATVKNVDKAGLMSIGAYRSKADYRAPKVVEINGIRVGFTNYTDNLNRKEKYAPKAALQYGVRHIKHSNIKNDISALRKAGAEFVVVFMHWGREYLTKPPDNVKKMAKKLTAAGADLIIGGHPHSVQPFAYVTAKDNKGNKRRALVMYSLGNFLTHQRGRDHDSGVIFEFTLERNAKEKIEITGARYVPVWVWLISKNGVEDCRVLPVGKYLNDKPKGMSQRDHKLLNRAWKTLTKRLGSKYARAANE